jgi:hypothetical protein
VRGVRSATSPDQPPQRSDPLTSGKAPNRA